MGQLREISNVRLEEVSVKLAEQAKTLESAFMNDFVAEINIQFSLSALRLLTVFSFMTRQESDLLRSF